MSNHPNISTYLDLVDPQKDIDRNQIAIQIGTLASIQSIAETLPQLNSDHQEIVKNCLSDPQKALQTDIFAIYKSENLLEQFMEILEKHTKELTTDYIKTTFSALPPDRQSFYLSQNPDLSSLIKS